MEKEENLRVGTKVKITSCIIEEAIGCTGEIWSKEKNICGGVQYNVYVNKLKAYPEGVIISIGFGNIERVNKKKIKDTGRSTLKVILGGRK